MTDKRGLDPLVFTIETRALIVAPTSRKVVRFDPPRLAVDCPMCEWLTTAPNSPGGLVLAEQARAVHANTVHPEAVIAGGLVMPPVAIIRGTVVTRGRRAVGTDPVLATVPAAGIIRADEVEDSR